MPDMTQVEGFLEKIKPAVEGFASAMALKVDQLWTIGILKQRVEGILYTLAAILMGFIAVYTVKKMFPWAKKQAEDSYGGEVAYMIPTILGLGSSALFFLNLYNGLLHLIVPQYTLIMEIIGMMNNAA